VIEPRPIQTLPSHLIDQIKAGEVIERPAHLIKELIENAIDAGATKIELEITDNGLDKIMIKDNGHGIKASDIELAFTRHATSKIHEFQDLYELMSYGFRGEALGSIASVSKINCISFTQIENEGVRFTIEGGLNPATFTQQKTDQLHGTSLVIKDLFFNTPARLKFLQSMQNEKTWIKKVFYSFVLGHPEIHFSFSLDDEKWVFPALTKNDRKGRLFQLASNPDLMIKEVQKTFHDMKVEIFLIPQNAKLKTRLGYLLINDRLVLDRSMSRMIQQMIESASPLEPFQELVCINLPPHLIDVNVHPNKTAVKIFEASKLWSFLSALIKDLFPAAKAPASSPALQTSSFFAPDVSSSREQSYRQHFELWKPTEKNPSEFIYAFDQNQWLITYVHDQKPYYLNLNQLLELGLKKASSTVPLLVSTPIEKKLLSLAIKNEWCQAYFEIDELSSTHWAIRGVPNTLMTFSIHHLIPRLLKLTIFEDSIVTHFEWLQLLDQLNADDVLATVLKPIKPPSL
jgi:DNA mismatch repair protein MutL